MNTTKKARRLCALALVLLGMLLANVALAEYSTPVSSVVNLGETSSFTGAANYSFPINVPAGLGGTTPELSLDYTSVAIDQGQPTTYSDWVRVGSGWSLNGLISIQEEKDVGITKYYLISGLTKQDLINEGSGVYHTRDEAFQQIKKVSNYWEIRDKDGTYYRLGYTADSRHYTYTHNYPTVSRDYRWDVDLRQDIHGNQIAYEYREWQDKHTKWYTDEYGRVFTTKSEVISGIKKITYTMSSQNGGAVVGQPITVEFNVADLYAWDTVYCYYTSVPKVPFIDYVINYLRYNEILVKVNGNLINKYNIAYNYAANTGNHTISSITTYAADGTTALPVTTFTYSGNLLTEVNNGTGGKKQYVYETYQVYSRDRHRVITEKSIDGMGNTYTTNYAYSGPQADGAGFWGHAYVKVTDAAGTTTETWYHQDAIKRGTPYEIQVKDSGGNLYSKTVNVYNYTTPLGGVHFTYLAQTDNYLYDGDSTYKQTQTQYTYDSYGSVTKTSSLGDVGVSGDEIYSYTEYINDTTNWILGVPKHTYTKKSDDATIAAESWYYYSWSYEGSADYGSSGRYLRKVETAAVFGSRGNAANPIVETNYDQWGNAIAVTDAMGNTTTTAYDSVFHAFPISVTNAKNQTSYTYYYGVNAEGDPGFTGSGLFGQVKSTKDINGQFARSKYDIFGRPIATWSGNFSEASPEVIYGYRFYTSATDPAATGTYQRKAVGSAEYFFTLTYYDGLGRTIQSQSSCEEAGKVMVSGPVEYNSRGLMYKQYVGYKTAGDGHTYIANPTKEKATTFNYDAVGRLTRTDYPDGTYTRTVYSDFVTTAIDANNKQVRSTTDAYGRVVTKESFTGSYPNATLYATTTYEYDALGRCLKITDPQGNQNTNTYDNLGRKTSMLDMDMGNWSYQYDKLGRLISQTDAKGQTITMEYDVLGRLIKKTNPDGTYKCYIYDSLEGYSGANPLGKLLKVYEGSE